MNIKSESYSKAKVICVDVYQIYTKQNWSRAKRNENRVAYDLNRNKLKYFNDHNQNYECTQYITYMQLKPVFRIKHSVDIENVYIVSHTNIQKSNEQNIDNDEIQKHD